MEFGFGVSGLRGYKGLFLEPFGSSLGSPNRRIPGVSRA